MNPDPGRPNLDGYKRQLADYLRDRRAAAAKSDLSRGLLASALRLGATTAPIMRTVYAIRDATRINNTPGAEGLELALMQYAKKHEAVSAAVAELDDEFAETVRCALALLNGLES